MKTLIKFIFLTLSVLQMPSMLAQVEVSEISGSGSIELINNGTSAVDISNYWLCNRPAYSRLSTLDIECGSLDLEAGATVTINDPAFRLDGSGDELGVYLNSNFGSSASLIDYVIWGNRNGSTREALASSDGLWIQGQRASAFGQSESLNRTGNTNNASAWSIASPTICEAAMVDCDVNGGIIELATGGTSTSICVDGNADPLSVVFTTDSRGSSLGYIITDDNNNILARPSGGPFDLDGAGVGICYIYAVSYEPSFAGATVGNNISDLEGCFELSNFIMVTREAPDGGMVGLIDGGDTFSHCAGDNIVFDVTHTTSSPNLSYWYIITDNNDIILDWVNSANSNTIDASSAPAGQCRVWGWNYRGLGDPVRGQNISTLMDDDCEDISNNFITVNRETPDGGTVALIDGGDTFSHCAGDNIVFDVTHTTSSPNLSYWYIITDNNNVILDWVNSANSNTIDASAAPAGQCRVWGWNYRGLGDPVRGQNISTLMDDDCEDISEDFITVNREIPDGGTVTLTNGQTEYTGIAGDISVSVQHTTSAPYLSYWLSLIHISEPTRPY